MWIKRYFEKKIKWKTLTGYMMQKSDFELLCKLDSSSNMKGALTNFHEQVLQCWYLHHSKSPKTYEQVLNRFGIINLLIDEKTYLRSISIGIGKEF